MSHAVVAEATTSDYSELSCPDCYDFAPFHISAAKVYRLVRETPETAFPPVSAPEDATANLIAIEWLKVPLRWSD